MTKAEVRRWCAVGRAMAAREAAAKAAEAAARSAQPTAPVAAPVPDRVEDEPIDAATLDVDDLRDLLATCGIAGADLELRSPTMHRRDPRVAQRIAERAAASLRARTDRLSVGAIDGRVADATAVRGRLRDLGLDQHLALDVGPAPRKRPAPVSSHPAADEALTRRAEAEARVRGWVRESGRVGRMLDANLLTPIEFEALARVRGLGAGA